MNVRVVSIGIINKSHVHPREVFADVIAERASAVIIAHNHPNGDLTPSAEDNQGNKTNKRSNHDFGFIPSRSHHFQFKKLLFICGKK
jgi:DNA repair protein RadC